MGKAMGIDLTGQTGIVTGASSGIGAGIAKALAGAGAWVGVNYRSSEDKAQAVVKEIADSGGRASALQADVGKEEDVERLFAETLRERDRLDILIVNAGVQNAAPIQEMSLEDWNMVIGTNLTGAFLCARAACRRFLDQPAPGEGKPLGNIVFISSVHEVIPWSGESNYAASKGGISLFMRSLAQELGPRRIRVNGVAPGAIKTPINREVWDNPAKREKLLKKIPYGRVGEPEDIANAVLWLVSEHSDYVHGETLFVGRRHDPLPELHEIELTLIARLSSLKPAKNRGRSQPGGPCSVINLLPENPVRSEIEDLVRLQGLFIKELLVGQAHHLVGIHTVDGHALASGHEHSLAQAEEFGLLADREPWAIPLEVVHRRAVEEDGHLLVLVQKEIPEADGVPADLRVAAGENDQKAHGRTSFARVCFPCISPHGSAVKSHLNS
jgi:glucose 1-dehydrogenase